MRATNHVLTGALIGATVTEPLIALPLALASHFALDSLPHYGGNNHTKKQFLIELLIDCSLAGLFLIIVFLIKPTNWLLIIGCGILAASPDLMWFPRYIKELRLGHELKERTNVITRFHHRIQWAEKKYFWWVELIWAAAITALLVIPGKI